MRRFLPLLLVFVAAAAFGQVTSPPYAPAGTVSLQPSSATNTAVGQANATAIQNALLAASVPNSTPIAPLIDNSATASTSGAASVTISAYGTFGWNRATFVSIQYSNASTPVSGVTFGGTAMTLLQSSPAATAGMDVYYIQNASIGTSSIPNIVVSNSNSSVAETINVVSLSGVHSVGTPVANSGSGTTATNTISSNSVGHVVLDFTSCINGTAASGSANVAAPAVNTTAPEYATQKQITQGSIQGSSETLPGASSVSVTWTVPNGAWTNIAVDLTGQVSQGLSANPGTVYIPGVAGQSVTYYLAMPAGNTYGCIEALYLSNVKLVIDPGVTLRLCNSASAYPLIAYDCTNFEVRGGLWDGNSANQSIVNTGNNSAWNGWRTYTWIGDALLFDNCSATLVQGCKFTDFLRCCIQPVFCSNFWCRDIYAYNTWEIFQVEGGTNGARFENITGYNLKETLSSEIPHDYPMDDIGGGGNVENVVCSGLYDWEPASNNPFEVNRIAGGANTYGVYNCTIEHVRGSLPPNSNGVTIVDDNTYPTTAGTVADGIVYDDIAISSQFNGNCYPFVMSGTHVKNVTCRHFRCWNLLNIYADDSVFIVVGNMDSLKIEDCDIPASANYNANFVTVTSGGVINNDLELLRCNYAVNSGATTTGRMVRIRNNSGAATCNYIHMTDCVMINGKAMFENDTGVTNKSISFVGCRVNATTIVANVNTAINIHAVGNDFSQAATNVLKNNTGGTGTVTWRGSGNLFIGSGYTYNLSIASSETNCSVSDPQFTLRADWVTPQIGDEFYNIHGSWGNGVGLYFYDGSVLTKLNEGMLGSLAAAGSAVTGTSSETQAASVTIPASVLVAGSTFTVDFAGIQTAENGSDTLTVRLRFGTTSLSGTVVCGGSAVTGAASDVFQGHITFTVRGAPSSSTAVVASGMYQDVATSSAGTFKPIQLASTNFATNGALVVECTLQFSSNSASDSARVDTFVVRKAG